MITKGAERSIGIVIAIVAIAFFIIYAYLLLLSEWREIILSISVLVIVGAVVGAVVWLGLAIAKSAKDVKDR